MGRFAESWLSATEEGSQTKCCCGAPIPDEGDRQAHKRFLVSESDYDDLLAASLTEFRAFLAADTVAARDAWMSRHFGLQWRRELSDAEHLEAFLHGLIADRCRLVYECVECDRLLIDERTDDTIRLVSYRSSRGYRHLLATPLFRHGGEARQTEPDAAAEGGSNFGSS